MTGWPLAWALARRELRARFRGLRLLLVCLFLGVGALAAIGSLTAAMGGELGARGRVILGGDAEFAASQRSATPAERAAMARLGRLSETVRAQAQAVVDRPTGPEAAPVALKAVDRAYPLYGALRLADGRTVRPADPNRVWIGPALRDRLGVQVGQRLRFGTATFTVDGIVADEPDRLGEGFTLGPVAIVTLDGARRTGLFQPGSLYETKYRVALPLGADPQAAVDGFTNAFPTAGWEARSRDNAAPGASRFIERMGQFLLLVGLAALVIAGIGVGNGVSSYLQARRGSIATLKVLGATSADIGRVYLLQIVAVAGVGIAAGLLAGLAAVPLIVRAAGELLPVAPGFAVHPLPLLLAAAYGLLIALAFTAPSLAQAGAVPAAALLRGGLDPRRAPLRRSLPLALAAGALVIALALLTAEQPLLTAGFLAATAAVLLLLGAIGWVVTRLAAALPRPRRPFLRLALAGLHRPGAATGRLVVALGLGLTLFVLLAAIRTSLDANIARTVPQRAPALFALDVPKDRADEFRAVVRGASPTAQVAAVPALRGTITAYGNTQVADLTEIPEGAWALRGERGLTYAEELPEGSTLTAGGWWPRGYNGPPLVSVDERLADVLRLKIGDPLSVSLLGVERTARVASFRRIDWDTLGFNYVLVFSPNALRDAPHNLAATIDAPAAGVGRIQRALLPRFPSVSVIEVGGVLAQVRDVVSGVASAVAAAASVAILAGVAVLIGALAAASAARTYDGVILKTLGATRAQVLGVQALQWALLASILAVVAAALGLGAGWYVVTRLFEFEWLPDYGLVALTLLLGAGATVLLGVLGGLPVLNARPARALRTV